MKTAIGFVLGCGVALTSMFAGQDEEQDTAQAIEDKPLTIDATIEDQDLNGLQARWIESALTWQGDETGAWVDFSIQATQTGTVLGVHVRRPDETLRHHLKMETGMGLVIEQVIDGSSAATAGLQEHDVLVAYEDQLLVNQEQLTTLVRNTAVGEVVTLSIFREGRRDEIDVELQEGSIAQAESIDASTSGWLLEVHPHINLTGHAQGADMTNCTNCHQVDSVQFWEGVR